MDELEPSDRRLNDVERHYLITQIQDQNMGELRTIYDTAVSVYALCPCVWHADAIVGIAAVAQIRSREGFTIVE